MAKRVTEHQQQHVQSLVAKYSAVLMRRRRLAPQQGCFVGGRGHIRRCAPARLPEIVFDEFLEFAAAPPTNAMTMTSRRIGEHAEGSTCDAGAGKDTQALPLQQVTKVFSARTPRSSLPPMRARAWAAGGAAESA